MMPKETEERDLDAATIDHSHIFVVDGDNLCIESKEVGGQLFYTLK